MLFRSTSLGRISVSIGVATCNTAEACSPSGLVESADHALYEAKNAGRNRLAVAGENDVVNKCDGCSSLLLTKNDMTLQ